MRRMRNFLLDAYDAPSDKFLLITSPKDTIRPNPVQRRNLGSKLRTRTSSELTFLEGRKNETYCITIDRVNPPVLKLKAAPPSVVQF